MNVSILDYMSHFKHLIKDRYRYRKYCRHYLDTKNPFTGFFYNLDRYNPKRFLAEVNWRNGKYGGRLEHIPKSNKIIRRYNNYRTDYEYQMYIHYKNNRHYWQYWMDENNNPIDIPDKYIPIIVAHIANDNNMYRPKEAQLGYIINYNKFIFSRKTRLKIEKFLGLNSHKECTLKDLALSMGEKEYNCYFSLINNFYNIDSYSFIIK